MQLFVQEQASRTYVRVEDRRIDAAAAIRFKEEMRTATAQRGGPVLLDLSQVDFLDSSGLGAVVAVKKLLGTTRPLELAGLTPTVAKVFRLTRMDSVFVIHPDIAVDGRHAG
jgi:anti-sigma B factor antagonist